MLDLIPLITICRPKRLPPNSRRPLSAPTSSTASARVTDVRPMRCYGDVSRTTPSRRLPTTSRRHATACRTSCDRRGNNNHRSICGKRVGPPRLGAAALRSAGSATTASSARHAWAEGDAARSEASTPVRKERRREGAEGSGEDERRRGRRRETRPARGERRGEGVI